MEINQTLRYSRSLHPISVPPPPATYSFSPPPLSSSNSFSPPPSSSSLPSSRSFRPTNPPSSQITLDSPASSPLKNENFMLTLSNLVRQKDKSSCCLLEINQQTTMLPISKERWKWDITLSYQCTHETSGEPLKKVFSAAENKKKAGIRVAAQHALEWWRTLHPPVPESRSKKRKKGRTEILGKRLKTEQGSSPSIPLPTPQLQTTPQGLQATPQGLQSRPQLTSVVPGQQNIHIYRVNSSSQQQQPSPQRQLPPKSTQRSPRTRVPNYSRMLSRLSKPAQDVNCQVSDLKTAAVHSPVERKWTATTSLQYRCVHEIENKEIFVNNGFSGTAPKKREAEQASHKAVVDWWITNHPTAFASRPLTDEQKLAFASAPYGLGEKMEPAVLSLFEQVVTNDTKRLEEWLELHHLTNNETTTTSPVTVIGLNLEFNHAHKPCVLSLAVNGSVCVYSFEKKIRSGHRDQCQKRLPLKLQELFLNPNIYKATVEGRKQKIFCRLFSVRDGTVVGLLGEATKLGKTYTKCSVLYADSLGLEPRKHPRVVKSRWGDWPLSDSQRNYAALDAYLNFQVALAVATEVKVRGVNVPDWAHAPNLESDFKSQVDKFKDDYKDDILPETTNKISTENSNQSILNDSSSSSDPSSASSRPLVSESSGLTS